VAASLVPLLFAATSAWAAAQPSARSAERQKVEARLVLLEQRLLQEPPEKSPAWVGAGYARRQVALARKLLKQGDHRAAGLLAQQAERTLADVEVSR
jgi:hypothetical protein